VSALGLGQIVIAGNSFGGRVAQVFAADYPQLCAAAAILAAHLSNFYHDRERMSSVLRSACSMLNSPTEFASRDAGMAYLNETRGTRETEAVGERRLGCWAITDLGRRLLVGVTNPSGREFVMRSGCGVVGRHGKARMGGSDVPLLIATYRLLAAAVV
jgi:pimeloyl-ACP methyl ester carboxylesterase